MQSTLESRHAPRQSATRRRPACRDHHGRQRTLGASGAACRAAPAIAKASRRCAASSRPRPMLGVGTLTLFAFSSDNWRRPPLEVEVLMLLLRQYLRRDLRRLVDNGVRLKVIGRRDRLPDGLAAGDRDRRSRLRARHAARTQRRARLLGARRDRERGRRLARRRLAAARGVRPPAGVAGPRHRPRRRPADPHRRREAALGFPALGMRLRGAAASSTPSGPTSAPSTCAPRSRDFHDARAPLRRPDAARRGRMNFHPQRRHDD